MNSRDGLLSIFFTMHIALAGCGDDGDGTSYDAGSEDSGGLGGDTSVPEVDSGSPQNDAGLAGEDAGLPIDAGEYLPCPITGTWELQQLVCGQGETETDITSSFRKVVTQTTAVITDTGTGQCAIVLTNRTPEVCTEVQEFRATPSIDGVTFTTTSLGITSCDPDACSFGGKDEPCVVGDRMETFTESLMPGNVVFSTVRVDGGICSNFGLSPTTMTWRPAGT